MTSQFDKRQKRKSRGIEFEEYMIKAAIEHILEGGSFNTCGPKYGISTCRWSEIADENPELSAIRSAYNKAVNHKRRMFK